MTPERISDLIKKVNQGIASEAEKQALENFWQVASADETVLDQMNTREREALRQSILASAMSVVRRERSVSVSNRRFLHRPAIWRVAASLIIIAIAAFWYFDTDTFVEQLTAYGETREITLPDGSQLILNANSSARFVEQWSESDDREVWIRGEGFFDVQHTKNHQKFVVHTDQQLDVQVLGTRFNVKVRRARAEVVLEEGSVKVSLTDSDRTRILEPGDMVSLENHKLVDTQVDPSRYASWRNNKLFFDQTPLIEVARILEDTYGYQVIFKRKSLMKRRLSGELQSGKVEDIVKAVEESLQIRVTKEEQTIYFN